MANDKPVTLDIPGDAPQWAHRLFAGQYELRLEFRQHLRHCRDQHHELKAQGQLDPVSKIERWVKLVLMVGALVGGYMAIHDLRVTKASPPQVTVQQPLPQTVMVPYPVARDGGTWRPPRPLRSRPRR